MKHARVSGSKIEKIGMCPGSLSFCANIVVQEGPQAREGTAAHELLRMALTNGPEFNVWNVSHIPMVSGPAFDVDMDMRTAVSHAVKKVREIAESMLAPIQCEVSFDLRENLPADLRSVEIGGTADVVISAPFESLVVLDYKHGVGVPVDAAGNWQIRFYAIGALMRCKTVPADVRLIICQPRSAHGAAWSEETLSVQELLDWWNSKVVPAVREAIGHNPSFHAGKWCKFCPGLGTCAAVSKANCEAAGVIFAGTAPLAKKEIHLPAPEDCTDNVLQRCCDAAALIRDWAKACEEEVARRLLTGATNPARIGYKFVAGRNSRSWSDPAAVQAALAKYGTKIMSTPELLTPAQMEEMLKREGAPVSDMTKFVVTKQGKTLVPATDKRDALPLTPQQAFGVEVTEKE